MCTNMGKAEATQADRSGVHTVSTLQPGDKIDGRKMIATDNGYKYNEDYAYWTTVKSDGTKSRGDYKSMDLEVQKVEPKGNKIKITAVFDLKDLYRLDDTENRKKAPKRIITRTFNKDDLVKIYKTQG